MRDYLDTQSYLCSGLEIDRPYYVVFIYGLLLMDLTIE